MISSHSSESLNRHLTVGLHVFQTHAGMKCWQSFIFIACAENAVVGQEKTQMEVRLRCKTGNSILSLLTPKSTNGLSFEIEK